jgi:hypothetical protein
MYPTSNVYAVHVDRAPAAGTPEAHVVFDGSSLTLLCSIVWNG